MAVIAAALLTLTTAIAQGDALHIVVIAGEDAVNIVQQKTAVAPVVEVRDRNNQPVAGAIVRFVIQQGHGTFAGARTVSVTTNAAGRALAAGLTPTGNGALQIGASATFQGQTAVATITQTNVMTAAQAAGASSGASSAATSGGAGGAGGGGGISGTAIGIVSGVAAAGALVAVTGTGGSADAPVEQPTTYRGSFSMQSVYNTTTLTNGVVTGFCANQAVTLSGTITATLDSHGAGSIDMEWTEAIAPAGQCTGASPSMHISGPVDNSATITLTNESPSDYQSPAGTIRLVRRSAFSGALDGSAVNGKVTMSEDHTLIAPAGPNITFSGGIPAVSTSVTLTKQ